MVKSGMSTRLDSFISRNGDRFKFVSKGYRNRDKVRLLRVAALNILPKKLLEVTKLHQKVSNEIERGCKETKVNAGSYIIELSDFESYNFIKSIKLVEPFMTKHFHPKLGDVIIDVGAYIGTFTIPTAKAVGNEGFVLAIEPTPKTYNALIRNLLANDLKNVKVYNGAAYKEQTELCFYISSDNSSESGIYKKQKGKKLRVKADTIDHLLNMLPANANHLDWVKIDVEAGELNVLEGMVETLKKFNPTLIIEVWEHNEQALFSFLKTQGYAYEVISKMIPYKSTYNFHLKCQRLDMQQVNVEAN